MCTLIFRSLRVRRSDDTSPTIDRIRSDQLDGHNRSTGHEFDQASGTKHGQVESKITSQRYLRKEIFGFVFGIEVHHFVLRYSDHAHARNVEAILIDSTDDVAQIPNCIRFDDG